MKHYSAANPNGPGVDTLPHYAAQERALHERREAHRRRSEIEQRTPVTAHNRCVWPSCGNLQMKYDEIAQATYEPGTVDVVPLCWYHTDWTLQRAFDAGMRPMGPDGSPVGLTRRPSKMRQRPGFIYYIRVGDVIKIGFASDLKSRLTHYPPNAVYLLAHRGTRADESDIHGRLLASRSHGKEWYRITPEVTAFIEQQLAAYEAIEDPRPKPRIGQVVRPRISSARAI